MVKSAPPPAQGGWTETVVASSVDLAATVAHVCKLALLPDARPAGLAPSG